MAMCGFINMCMVLEEARDIRYPKAEVTSSYELFEMGAGNQTQIL